MFKNKNKNLTAVIKKKLEKTFHSKSYFTRFRGLISTILRKIVGLLLPSTAEILDLSTLPALNDFFQDYDFARIIKLPKNHFKLISLIFLRITRMKQFLEFL